MSSKFWSKKGNTGVHTCLARPTISEEQKKKNEEFRKRQQEFFRKQFAGLQNIGAQDPAASGTPINFVQKPNGKLAAEVPKPVPLGGRKPKPFNPKKLREYINKIKK